MNPLRGTHLYLGRGETLAQRGKVMPLFEENPFLTVGNLYYPDENLLDAVNVAISLGMPLLLTGEPGTGKTQLANGIAWELGLGEPLVFHTKSTSTYTDLFYQYDSLGHFRDIQIEGAAARNGMPTNKVEIDNYITYGPLGRAILLALDRGAPNCPPEFRNQPQRRSLVLVDELDKAPRDLPNDILNEVERMEFEIKELPPGENRFRAAGSYRPILILTSNLERDLPEAFRRRCVFYHIQFEDLDLREIIRRRLPQIPEFTDQMLENAVAHFRNLRERNLDKNPGPAELIAWIDLLQRLKLDVSEDVKSLSKEQRVALAASYSILAKSDDDLERLRKDVLAGP
jgi:MoxR-like ATPase